MSALLVSRARGDTIQRTIDQDARANAMDWISTRTRSFVVAVTRLNLPKLGATIDGALGPADGSVRQVSRLSRSTSTTGLATALVQLGEKDLGILSSRLQDRKPGGDQLLKQLEGFVPEALPALLLATPDTQKDFAAIAKKIKNPFLKQKIGGSTFEFSKTMALHMLRRHHPAFLAGDPMQVQSYFARGTTLKHIEALMVGAMRTEANAVKAWRVRRGNLKPGQLAGQNENTLNLRPKFDGTYWELTLTLPDQKPMAAKGVVAHFTPTL